MMISIYGAEYAKAVSSQSGWEDLVSKNTRNAPEGNNVSGLINPDNTVDYLTQAFGGLPVLWTGRAGFILAYYYVSADTQHHIYWLAREIVDNNISFCKTCSGGSRG